MAKNDLNVALIGLDTSHTVAFARLIHGDAPAEQRINGLRVSGCMRFPSAFQSEEGQDKRQAELESMGIKVTRSLDEAVRGTDALMLEINDPALHLEYFEKVAPLKKPVFLDKPLADTLENGRKIIALAAQHGISLWSSSSLRFVPEAAAARAAVPAPLTCCVHGILGKPAKGSDVVWYGIHAVELLATLIGCGARAVRAHRDPCGVVIVAQYDGARRGIVELNSNCPHYGGCVQAKDGCYHFKAETQALYVYLMRQVRESFLNGTTAVPLKETVEVQAILNAADRSIAEGSEVNVER